MEETTENTDNKQKYWLFKKGVSGNPEGRPKGSISPITKVKQIFEADPEGFQEFIKEYIKDPSNRKHIVEMIDGKPRMNIGLDGGEGKPINIEISKEIAFKNNIT